MHATDPTPPTGPQVVVDLDAIAHNVRVLREHAGPAAVMAVVKADGYGHGAAAVARAALAAGASEVGVVTVGEIGRASGRERACLSGGAGEWSTATMPRSWG